MAPTRANTGRKRKASEAELSNDDDVQDNASQANQNVGRANTGDNPDDEEMTEVEEEDADGGTEDEDHQEDEEQPQPPPRKRRRRRSAGSRNYHGREPAFVIQGRAAREGRRIMTRGQTRAALAANANPAPIFQAIATSPRRTRRRNCHFPPPTPTPSRK
ncbi:hypothetical protein GE09DRAFT_1049882 [Coniochaeta sp. 2T2.1]|nr:hypothetical protein GE09DRAFT_1049882 [Coniochaeta sp. 2T2.1]